MGLGLAGAIVGAWDAVVKVSLSEVLDGDAEGQQVAGRRPRSADSVPTGPLVVSSCLMPLPCRIACAGYKELEALIGL